MSRKRFIFRGESISHSEEFGVLSFPVAEDRLRQYQKSLDDDPVRADMMDKYTADCRYVTADNTSDISKFCYFHVKGEGGKNSINYLSFSENFDSAKKFATIGGLVRGRVFKIDTQKLSVQDFIFAPIKNIERITDDPCVNLPDEEEVGILSRNGAAFPSNAIVDITEVE